MLNAIWIAMLFIAVICGAFAGKVDAVAKATTDAAGSAVDLAIGLVGVMTFFIGLMRVLEVAGAMRALTRLVAPLMRRLFPDVPADHPAMSMMILNIAANMLGLANAATPFGLKAMLELDKLNRQRGTASNAMALFLAINTSGLALLPTGVIGLRASLGSTSPGSIIVPTLIATFCSTSVAILVAKLTERLGLFAIGAAAVGEVAPAPGAPEIDTREAEASLTALRPSASGWRRAALLALFALVAASIAYSLLESASGTPPSFLGVKSLLEAAPVEQGIGWGLALRSLSSTWPLPLLIVALTAVGMWKGIKVYDTLVDGGKEGFQIALRIIPYLVAILVVVGMLRASGALDLMVSALSDVTAVVRMPAETLPMALLRPLTGSGAFGFAAETMKTHGPDSLIGMIVSTMQGSTETTFYVMALYFGVVQVRRTRHTLIACLAADVAGLLTAVWAVRLFMQ